MTRLLKLLYMLVILAMGTALSVFLIYLAISEHDDEGQVADDVESFPDYLQQLNDYYDNYENQSDHFHLDTRRHFAELDKQEVCLTCHSIWPHKKDPKTRAFYNQHSRYMTCMACHLNSEPGREDGFTWWDFDIDNSITRLGPYGLDRDAQGRLLAEENFITRIVPVMIDGDQQTRIYTPYNTPLYAQYREDVEAGRQVDSLAVRKAAEALVGKEALSCGSCHSEMSNFPWEELGFSAERIDEMTHSAVVGMVEKYESFYFPPVFE